LAWTWRYYQICLRRLSVVHLLCQMSDRSVWRNRAAICGQHRRQFVPSCKNSTALTPGRDTKGEPSRRQKSIERTSRGLRYRGGSCLRQSKSGRVALSRCPRCVDHPADRPRAQCLTQCIFQVSATRNLTSAMANFRCISICARSATSTLFVGSALHVPARWICIGATGLNFPTMQRMRLDPRSDRACRRAPANQGQAFRVAAEDGASLNAPRPRQPRR
jgi:hypothetical protein